MAYRSTLRWFGRGRWEENDSEGELVIATVTQSLLCVAIQTSVWYILHKCTYSTPVLYQYICAYILCKYVLAFLYAYIYIHMHWYICDSMDACTCACMQGVLHVVLRVCCYRTVYVTTLFCSPRVEVLWMLLSLS